MPPINGGDDIVAPDCARPTTRLSTTVTCDDETYGEPGNDRLEGGVGNDRDRGGAGNDQLEGGGGADLEDGGAGSDMIVGGAGKTSSTAAPATT